MSYCCLPAHHISIYVANRIFLQVQTLLDGVLIQCQYYPCEFKNTKNEVEVHEQTCEFARIMQEQAGANYYFISGLFLGTKWIKFNPIEWRLCREQSRRHVLV
jgi:hypothetical protein